MKAKRVYYFSVEGETEQWYLEWLQRQINQDPAAKYFVKIDSKVQKDPFSRAKGMSILSKTEITHLFDYESDEPEHAQGFMKTMDQMKAVRNSGKSITYRMGYSNFSFELWIILHTGDCNGRLTHRKQYLAPLNRAYHENFDTLDQYKHENNFKRLLSKLSLNHARRN